MKTKHVLYIFFFLFSLTCYSNTLVVFIDNTRNLDYFVDGKKYKLKRDIKELYQEYNVDSDDRLIIVDVRKYKEKKVKGKIIIIGNGVDLESKFTSKKTLSKLVSDHVTNKVNFLLLGHSISSDRFEDFLQFPDSKYGLILVSACKMASIEKLRIMSKYSSYAIASPENIHLAHLEIKNINKYLKSTDVENGKEIVDKSFNRLLNYTKSNLVLNLYNVDFELLTSNPCESNNVDELIVYQKIKLSKFEKAKEDSVKFKLLNCK